MATRNQNGQFVGALKAQDADDKTFNETDFRKHETAVSELKAFLESDTGVMLRMVLRGRRRAIVSTTHVKPEEAAAQLAKMQAFEEFTALLVERLTDRIQPEQTPVSRKGGARPISNVAMMP
jgi:hypothetical protein